MSYLLDTNILIYYNSDVIPEMELQKIEAVLEDSFNISIITKMEYLGWRELSDVQFAEATEFLNNATIINLDETIVEETIKLKRERKIKLPDAIIAATCIAKNLTLVTSNIGDFKKIANLSIYDPFESVKKEMR